MSDTKTAYEGVEALTIVKTRDGKQAYVYRGAPVPRDVDDSELERLLEEGFIAKVDTAPAAPAVDAKPANAADILKEVGNDPGKAKAALAAEEARGDDARSGLVAKLQKISGQE